MDTFNLDTFDLADFLVTHWAGIDVWGKLHLNIADIKLQVLHGAATRGPNRIREVVALGRRGVGRL